MSPNLAKERAIEVVDQMFYNDPFSQWLGIERLEVDAGMCRLQMTARQEMLNGHGILHGAISYALADSALAFAANSYGRKSVSVETSISHLKPCAVDDVLLATAEEVSRSNRIALYHIGVRNQHNDLVAQFKGTVYRTSAEWPTQLGK